MKIKFIKEVIFKDMEGTVLKVYKVGAVINYTAKTSTYYVCSMGGIYFDEAEEISP